MKTKIFLRAVLLILFACAVASGADNDRGDFVYTSGAELMKAGKPFRYMGTNCYYLMVYSVQPDMRRCTDEVFDDAKAIGLKVVRTWAFNDGKRQWQALQTSPGSYKEGVFVGLDYVIAKAKEKGIYLVLSLGNNWDNYGGIKQYLDWSSTALKKEHNEFFTDANCRQYFKDNIKAVLERENTITGVKYKDEPTILAWEIMNEPRAEGDQSGELLYNWLKEMSAYIKSIDKNHLVMSGKEGFYAKVNTYDWKFNGSKGADFARNITIKDIDIASIHLWPSSSDYSMISTDITKWIRMHAQDARKLKKPIILGEFGMYRGYNGDTLERDKFYKLIIDTDEKAGVNGANFWLLLHNKYKPYDDGYGVYYPDDKSTIDILKSAVSKIK